MDATEVATRRPIMSELRRLSVWAALGLTLCACNAARGQTGLIEPGAGNWKTFAISSGKDFRAPAPPDAATTLHEIAWLKSFSADTDPRVEDRIRFWDSGAPAYRWIDLMVRRQAGGQPMTAFPH